VSDLPILAQGHAPLDGCHKTHSGVAIHVLPGCECAGPRQTIPAVKDIHGNIVRPEYDVVIPNHMNSSDGNISLDQARNMGLIP
jgi:hypothetical protein